MKKVAMKGSGKKATPSLPASSRLQGPSGTSSGKSSMKSMVKGSTKTKIK